MSFRTTHVGSLPRVDEYASDFALRTKHYVQMQVEAGLDEVNDGECLRGIYFGNITDLPCFKQGGYPMPWPSGDVIGTPVLAGPFEGPHEPLAAREVARVKGALEDLGVRKRVKVTIPSVSMMSYFYSEYAPVKDYPKDRYLEDVEKALVDEALFAVAAGADSVQFDAPTLFIAKPEERKSLVSLDNDLLDATRGSFTREVHCCWGNYWNTQLDSETRLDHVFTDLLELRTDVLGPLEVFDGIRDWDAVLGLVGAAPSFTARLAAGMISVKTRNVEPVSVLKKRWEALYEPYGERLVGSPGCGFASNPESIHSFESAKRKLANLCKAAA